MPPGAAADLPPASGPGGPNGPVGGGPGGGRGGSGDRSDGAGEGGSATTSLKAGLSPTDLAAGAGASIVSAILGSFLGALGTVLGAALGSIAYTLASTFLTSGIEHGRVKSVELREKAAARRGKGVAAGTVAAAQGAGPRTGEETVRLDPARAPGRTRSATSAPRRRIRMGRKSIIVATVGGVIAFAVAMFLVTGIEFVKGSTITGGNTGTSVGNAVGGGAPPQPADTGRDGGEEAPSESSTSTSTSESATTTSESATSTGESGGSQDSPQQDGTGNDGDSLQDRLNGVLPTQQPGAGQQGAEQGGSGQQGQDGSGSGSGN